MAAIIKQKRTRFLNNINSLNNIILIHSKDVSINKDAVLRRLAKSYNIKLQMTIKRLFHKLFIGKREKNEKTEMMGHAYIVSLNDKSNLDFFKYCKSKKIDVFGAVSDKKLDRNYIPYAYSGFNKEKLVVLCLFKIVKSMMVSINQVKIK